MYPVRIVLSKGGIDGHDEGSDMLAARLRDAGFEVVYLGAYMSPGEIAACAVEEDPDIVGVSINSGAHVGVLTDLMEELRRNDEDWLVVAGGLIPQRDYSAIKDAGVTDIFSSSAARSVERDIVPRLEELTMEARKKRAHDPDTIYADMKRGDRFSLARFITLLEKGNRRAFELVCRDQELYSTPPHVIGISGSGGTGKSTLVAEMLKLFYKKCRVAALCVDPVAVRGAVLGDRYRINDYGIAVSRNVFVRSHAARAPWRGVSRETPYIIKAMARAGYDIIIVETVGTGQADMEFADLTDTFIYVATHAIGDHVQLLKGGSIQTADIIAVNKADDQRTRSLTAALQQEFSVERYDGWTPHVIETEGITGRGVENLLTAIEDHWTFLAAHHAKAVAQRRLRVPRKRRKRNAE